MRKLPVIFIATFQNYRIVSSSLYFLCVWNDIFARHLRYASMIDSPPVTLQSRAGNDVTRVIAARRPWLSSVGELGAGGLLGSTSAGVGDGGGCCCC